MKKSAAMMVAAVVFLGAAKIWAADDVVALGKQVKLDYTLTVNNEQIETSIGKTPLQFVVGDKGIIPGLETALIGMHAGEEKVITVDPKDAYGAVDQKAFKEFPLSSLPKGMTPKVGMVLQAQAPDGESFAATISQLKTDKVVLDFNHPLAGKQLKFQVKILSIAPAPVPAPAAPLPSPVK